MPTPFPVTARDEVKPGDPKAEPTRAELAARGGETLVERIERTRRYFRLTRQKRKTKYARGLDSKPNDFA